MDMQTKYIVILGSLMSGLGKGVVTSSILKMLDFYGYSSFPIKFDGYLNYDCGTMNPYRHGEVFVLDDSSEVDMDFGIYERFLNRSLGGDLSITGGKLFGGVIGRERKGGFLGEDVQIIPHLTNEIIASVEGVAEKRKPNVLVVEVGGTVGDIENSYFIEAMRQLALRNQTLFVNLTYIPKLEAVGEQKTKPAQVGFRMLLQSGIRPDFVICRSSSELEDKTKEKLALFSNLGKERIIDDSDQKSIYLMPLHFMEQGLDRLIVDLLGLEKRELDRGKVDGWRRKVGNIINPAGKVRIAVVGKYTNLCDSYASIKEALIHSGSEINSGVEIDWIESEELEAPGKEGRLVDADGILVPGGFGSRGIEGMINAIKYAREKKVPYLGICLGMQLMTVEYARNVCSLMDANSSEFNEKSEHKVIDLMDSQKGVAEKGGTMRLGSWEAKLMEGSVAYKLYGSQMIKERHRHRYEFNNAYRKRLEDCGLVISGTTPDNKLVEFIEWKDSFGIGTQAHPELKSRLETPAPLFVGFLKEAAKHRKKK